jgi:hypothetical protein
VDLRGARVAQSGEFSKRHAHRVVVHLAGTCICFGEVDEGAFAATIAQERVKIHRRRRLAERAGAGRVKPLRSPKGSRLSH